MTHDPAHPPSPVPAPPPKVRVEPTPWGYLISWRWFRPVHLGLLVSSIIWNAFLVVWYTAALLGHAPWLMLALPIPLLVVGCAMTHATLAGFLNITRVELTMPELRTWHHPLPCRPIRQFAAPLMSHAICQQCGWHWRGFGARYVVKIALRDGTSSAFLAISDPAIADFLEHAINGFYRLDDGHAALEAV